jgi:hypothetical protein
MRKKKSKKEKALIPMQASLMKMKSTIVMKEGRRIKINTKTKAFNL